MIAAPDGWLRAGPVGEPGRSETLSADCDLALARDKRTGRTTTRSPTAGPEHYLAALADPAPGS